MMAEAESSIRIRFSNLLSKIGRTSRKRRRRGEASRELKLEVDVD